MISLVIGGTICEPHRLRVPRSSLVVLDYSDNSALGVIFGQHSSEKDERAEEEENDEEFQLLSAHRKTNTKENSGSNYVRILSKIFGQMINPVFENTSCV